MMGIWAVRAVVALTMLTGVTVRWTLFSSTLYPYSISQPSSFRHEVIISADGQHSDYFFASGLGSFTTNVNISATRGQGVTDEISYFRSHNGTRVHRSGWLRVMGRRLALVRADFHGLTGRWTEEQTRFKAHGMLWQLTVSYDPRFRRFRPTMLRMLSSFKLR